MYRKILFVFFVLCFCCMVKNKELIGAEKNTAIATKLKKALKIDGNLSDWSNEGKDNKETSERAN